jgi:hypothetical protein
MDSPTQDTLLLEDENAEGTIAAFVDQDDRVAHFFLSSIAPGGFGKKSCWVRNLVAAPEALDVAGMREGLPPLQPRGDCSHPDGAPPLDASRLTIVWLEEGTSAALLEDDEVIALIPSWAGDGGFRGYARDARGTGALAWELGPDNQLLRRVDKAREWWAQWEAGSHWAKLQPGWHSRYVDALGPEKRYYATDGGRWPPCALLRFPHAEGEVMLTLGVRLRPQPNVPDESPCRRVELAVFIERDVPEDATLRFASFLSGQSNYAWTHNTWLGDGHTIPCDAVPGFDAVLLTASPPIDVPALVADYRGDSVTVLWILAITREQRARARTEGSAPLRADLRRQGVRGIGARARPGLLSRLLRSK